VILFDLASLEVKLKEMEELSHVDNFWEDHEKAQKLLKEKKVVENKINDYKKLFGELQDIYVLIELADEEEDDSLLTEIEESYANLIKDSDAMKIKVLLDGQYDSNNAIISIHAGSGGLDAQDWAEMLLRMYTRWSDAKKYKVRTLDINSANEGGIKSATLLIEGENAYGYLKSEKGVHRVVRISPFDSSGRRHTSFASLDVMPELDQDVEVEIDPDDLRIDTFRSSGAGGQHVNKTDSAIRITHLPTNIVVTCQNERSQHQNKDFAMMVLKSKLIELKIQENKEKIDDLKGDYSQITWGSQIRSYVFHPYSLVKDHRTNAEVGNVNGVMDGDIDYFINEKLKQRQ
jgi:peptide chain release factor 2